MSEDATLEKGAIRELTQELITGDLQCADNSARKIPPAAGSARKTIKGAPSSAVLKTTKQQTQVGAVGALNHIEPTPAQHDDVLARGPLHKLIVVASRDTRAPEHPPILGHTQRDERL